MNAQKRDMRYEARPPGIGADLSGRGSRCEIREMNASRPGGQAGSETGGAVVRYEMWGARYRGDFDECWPMRGQM